MEQRLIIGLLLAILLWLMRGAGFVTVAVTIAAIIFYAFSPDWFSRKRPKS